MTWLYLMECEESFNKLEKRPVYAAPEFKEGFEYGWRAACRFLQSTPPEEGTTFRHIGYLHRPRDGTVNFHQDTFSIPLAVHGTLEVFIKERSNAASHSESKEK